MYVLMNLTFVLCLKKSSNCGESFHFEESFDIQCQKCFKNGIKMMIVSQYFM